MQISRFNMILAVHKSNMIVISITLAFTTLVVFQCTVHGDYVFDGASPKCWITMKKQITKCPTGFELKIAISDRSILAGIPTFGSFIAKFPNQTFDQIHNWKINKGGFSVCKDNLFCSPFANNFAAQSIEQSINLGNKKTIKFTQEFTIPNPGSFILISRIQFILNCFVKYDAASAIKILVKQTKWRSPWPRPSQTLHSAEKDEDTDLLKNWLLGISLTVICFILCFMVYFYLRKKNQFASTSLATSTGLTDRMISAMRIFSKTSPVPTPKCCKSSLFALYEKLRSLDNWVIDSSEVEVAGVIGRGSSGEVLKAKCMSIDVAVKRLNSNMLQIQDGFIKEINMLMTLRHPNIVQLLGISWLERYELCAVMEYMSRGDLANLLLHEVDIVKMQWKDCKINMATDCCIGLAYLHGLLPPIVHRDLKSNNVLITERFTAKLADFGLSRYISYTDTMSFVGSHLWLAPEIIRGEKFNEKVDIFSFGIVLCEINNETLPYEDQLRQEKNGYALAHDVAFNLLRPSLTSSCPDSIRNLISKCLLDDPNDRPEAKEIIFELKNIKTKLSSIHK